jgi:hypothetical protein
MKINTKANGSQPTQFNRAAEVANAFLHLKRAERERQFEEEAEKKCGRARKDITITVDAYTWGELCAAGLVHNTTPEHALEMFLGENDVISEWHHSGFAIGLPY